MRILGWTIQRTSTREKAIESLLAKLRAEQRAKMAAAVADNMRLKAAIHELWPEISQQVIERVARRIEHEEGA